MSHEPHDRVGQQPDTLPLDPHEQALLQHYRAHAPSEPSAALDARILAAASAALPAGDPRLAPTPGAMARLQGWLFGGSQRTRWSVAFASLATLGLGLGLTLHTVERSPERYEMAPVPMQAPVPAMEAVQSYAPPPAVAEKKRSAELSVNVAPAPAAPLAEAHTAVADEQVKAEAAMSSLSGRQADSAAKLQTSKAKSAAGQPVQALSEELHSALQQIVRLGDGGQQQLASEQLAALQRRYPGLDLQAELKRMQTSEARGSADSR